MVVLVVMDMVDTMVMEVMEVIMATGAMVVIMATTIMDLKQ